MPGLVRRGIGRLNRRVLIQTPGHSRDDVGEEIKTWNDGDTVWASIRPLSGAERVRAEQVEATVTHEIVMRYRDLDSTARLQWTDHEGGTRTYDIVSIIDEDTVGGQLTIMAKEST